MVTAHIIVHSKPTIDSNLGINHTFTIINMYSVSVVVENAVN